MTQPPRLARPEDELAIAGLLAAAFADYAKGLGREPGPYDWIPGRIAAGEIHVLPPGGPVEAVLILSDDAELSALVIDMLAVLPGSQGSGLGQALIGFAEREAGRIGRAKLRLYTVAAYDHLVDYYRRMGFQVSHLGSSPSGKDDVPRAFMVKDVAGAEVHP